MDGAYLVTAAALAGSDGDPLLGRALDDRFVVLEVRAFGARGTVVYGGHDLLQRDATIVKLARHPRADRAAFERLAWERRVLEALPPGVAPRARALGSLALEGAAFDADAASYLACDVARGRCLQQRSFTPEQLPHVATALCRAVAAVHEAGELHGDLKPEHGFYEAGSLQLIDFDAGAPPPRMTPAYLAPEASAPSAAADVYALGCTLYWCAEGHAPFAAPTFDALRELHAAAPAPDARAPEPVRRAIAAALRKDPRARPSARALADDLAALTAACPP